MGGQTNTFGSPKPISGAAVSAKATLVPVGILDRVKMGPIPITYTSTTFVIAATATNPVYIWVGNDLFKLEETLTYTWTAATNTILASTGVETASQAAVLGGWYFYVGITVSSTTGEGTFVLYPSQTAPNEASLNHPGTSKTKDYAYVGYQVISNVTAIAAVAMTKIGYRMNFAAFSVATAAASGGWVELAFTNAKALPKHGALGAKAGGYVTVGAGADSTVSVGSTSTAGQGIHYYLISGTSSTDINYALPAIPTTANGKVYAYDTIARGDVNITFIDDVV
jgi:hypothetical protein